MNNDPFIKLGYGMIAYRNLLVALIMLFSVMSVIGAGMMYVNSTGSGYGNQDISFINRFVLGNLGYATVECEITPFMQDNVYLNCPNGHITQLIDPVNGYGINEAPKHTPNKTILGIEQKEEHEKKLCPEDQNKKDPSKEWRRNRCLHKPHQNGSQSVNRTTVKEPKRF